MKLATIARYCLFLAMLLLAQAVFAQPVTMEMFTTSAVGNASGPVTTYSFPFAKNTNNPSGDTAVLNGANTVTFSFTNDQFSAYSTGNNHSVAFGYDGNGNAAPLFTSQLAVSPWNDALAGNYSASATNVGAGIDAANAAVEMSVDGVPLAGKPTNANYTYGTLNIAFSTPVTNPVLHFAGLGGNYFNGTPTIYFWTNLSLLSTTGQSLSRLSGDSNFTVTPTTISKGSATSGLQGVNSSDFVSGSVLVTGVNISTISFSISLYTSSTGLATVPNTGTSTNYVADSLLIAASYPVATPTVAVQKVTIGGAGGPFSFSSTNLNSALPSVTTVASNTATPLSPSPVAASASGATVTLAEVLPSTTPTYSFTSATCYDTNTSLSGNSTGNLSVLSGTSTVSIPAAYVVPGAAFVCQYTNTLVVSALSIAKTNTATSVASGSTTSYTITATNGGPFGAPNSLIVDPPVAGLNCTSVTCSGANCPAPANVTIANLQGGGINLTSFPANSSVSFNVQCNVTATGQ